MGAARAWPRILREVRPDALYLNSFFDPWFSIIPSAIARASRIPIVLAPRGELSAGALHVKPRKKELTLRVLRGVKLHARTIWQASSLSEAADIRKRIGASPAAIEIASNIIGTSSGRGAVTPKAAGVLRLMFLGRIARIKNLITAIRLVARSGGPLRLDIWGPTEDVAYGNECRAEAEKLPNGVEVHWCGDLPHGDVAVRMADYDAVLLPTFGENFGHVIFEALSSGLPVIISDQTPWRGLKQHGVGADLALEDEDGFVREIRHLRAMGEAEFASMRDACRTFARNWALTHDGAAAHDAMFRRAVEQHDSTRHSRR
jgi:glycosyltransferase involved in cell wall biosynthesis